MELIKFLFRPIILFKNGYVDLSLLAVSAILLVLLAIVSAAGFLSSPQVLPGAGLGLLIGILVILWEIARHKHRPAGGRYHATYIPHFIDGLFILALNITSKNGLFTGSLTAFLSYQLSLLVAFVIYERVSRTRFKWFELFPG